MKEIAGWKQHNDVIWKKDDFSIIFNMGPDEKYYGSASLYYKNDYITFIDYTEDTEEMLEVASRMIEDKWEKFNIEMDDEEEIYGHMIYPVTFSKLKKEDNDNTYRIRIQSFSDTFTADSVQDAMYRSNEIIESLRRVLKIDTFDKFVEEYRD